MNTARRFVCCACTAALFAGFVPTTTVAAPRTPQDAQEVLEVLPPRLPGAAAVAVEKDTLERVLLDVPELLQLAQREGDPRFLGQAEARLKPWLDQPAVPTRLRLLQARVLQAGHRFEAALKELDAVLVTDPYDSGALLMQASIHQVRGDYALAAEACRRARAPDVLVLAIVCGAMIEGLSGQASSALTTLTRIAALADTLTPEQQTWLLLGLGDLADRVGETTVAGAAYERAAGYSPDALAAWSDWLLEQHREAEVVRLLQDQRQHDGLLLRLARARASLDPAGAQADARELAERFEAASQRGRRTHLREQALLALHLQHDPQAALLLARENWLQQREPADARVWLEAARACAAQEDLEALRVWLRSTGLEDRHLAIAPAGADTLAAAGSPP